MVCRYLTYVNRTSTITHSLNINLLPSRPRTFLTLLILSSTLGFCLLHPTFVGYLDSKPFYSDFEVKKKKNDIIKVMGSESPFWPMFFFSICLFFWINSYLVKAYAVSSLLLVYIVTSTLWLVTTSSKEGNQMVIISEEFSKRRRPKVLS